MVEVSSLDRFWAAMEGRVLDRVPVIPVLHVAAVELIGATIGDYAAAPRTMADTVIAAYRRYGLDGVQLSLGVATEASGMGSSVVEAPDSLPKVVKPAMVEPGDLGGMTPPDPWMDGLMPRFLEGLRLTLDEIGQDACVMAVIRGPMNIASQIRGIQALMFDLIDRPDYARELLGFCTRVALVMGKAVMQLGAHVVVIGEAICSPAFISPTFYRQHVWEWHRQLCSDLRAAGDAATLMHICGDIRPILPDIASTSADIIDVDWQVSIAEARDLAGEEVVLRGNLDPVAALHDGSPELVDRLSRIALGEAGPQGRFILSSGCDIPPGTPSENIEAMVAAANR